MEEAKNSCVIIPKKEYEELLAKSNEDAITIRWGYYISRPYSLNTNIDGRLTLSEGLYKQVLRILHTINERIDEHISERTKFIEEVAEDNAKYRIIEKFKALPWYKRLWFDPLKL